MTFSRVMAAAGAGFIRAPRRRQAKGRRAPMPRAPGGAMRSSLAVLSSEAAFQRSKVTATIAPGVRDQRAHRVLIAPLQPQVDPVAYAGKRFLMQGSVHDRAQCGSALQ